jgi:hypothetical protein
MFLNEISMNIEIIERDSNLGKDDTSKLDVIRDCFFKMLDRKKLIMIW